MKQGLPKIEKIMFFLKGFNLDQAPDFFTYSVSVESAEPGDLRLSEC